MFPGVCRLILPGLLFLGAPFSQGQGRPQSFLNLSANTSDPDVSSDGRFLAFRWSPSDQSKWGLYVSPMRGGVPDLFVKDDDRGIALNPKWSPDGRWIAFLRSGSPRSGVLFVKSRMSGEERLLGSVCVDEEVWTSDGESVIAPSSANVGSGNECEMTNFSIRPGVKSALLGLRGKLPALSRDGTMLSFVHADEIRLSTVTPAGRLVGGGSTVMRGPAAISSLAWAADDDELLYVSADSPSLLKRVDARADSVARDALRVDGEIASIAVTPDGDLIGTLASRVNSLWAVDLAAAKARPFVVRKLPWNVGALTISPDRRKLIYSTSLSGGSDVYMANLSDSEPRRLFKVPLAIDQLTWSPDGQRIAMVGESGTGPARPSHLLIASVNGGSLSSVLEQFGSVYRVAWSQDNSELFAVADFKGATSIWKLKLAGGKLTRIADGGTREMEVSPDNRFLYLMRFGKNLVRVPVGGGTADPVAHDVLNFALSGDNIYVERQDLRPPAADGLNLYRIGADAPLLHFVANVGFPASSLMLPKGGSLLYMERLGPIEERVKTLGQLP